MNRQDRAPTPEPLVLAPEGQRAISVRRLGAAVWSRPGAWGPIWGLGIYTTVRRVSDGLLTWRLEETLPGQWTYYRTAEREAEREARERGLALVSVKLGTRAEVE